MQQSSAKRRRRAASPQASSRRSTNLSALCKSELVALVSQLQAQGKQAPEEVAAGDISGAPAPEKPAVAGAPPVAAKPLRGPCLFIDDSVRSGQTVEFPDGDVTVIGSVGSGAEIIAGGSIHVYGTLRGRALAGTAGDGTARIFCRRFEAELLAIDGRYRVAENLDPSLRGRPVQARLDGMAMTLSPLD
jgi:septum site-determining protein MinC